MRGRGENGTARLACRKRGCFREGDIAQVAADGGEVREGPADRLARLAVRGDRGELEPRVREREPQELTRDIPGAAEDDRGNARVHSSSSRSPECATASSPTAVITQSPSAAPFVIALNAGTFSRSRMMSTPTELSVDGPVTAAGSM